MGLNQAEGPREKPGVHGQEWSLQGRSMRLQLLFREVWWWREEGAEGVTSGDPG